MAPLLISCLGWLSSPAEWNWTTCLPTHPLACSLACMSLAVPGVSPRRKGRGRRLAGCQAREVVGRWSTLGTFTSQKLAVAALAKWVTVNVAQLTSNLSSHVWCRRVRVGHLPCRYGPVVCWGVVVGRSLASRKPGDPLPLPSKLAIWCDDTPPPPQRPGMLKSTEASKASTLLYFAFILHWNYTAKQNKSVERLIPNGAVTAMKAHDTRNCTSAIPQMT